MTPQPQPEPDWYLVSRDELRKLMSWSTHKSPAVCQYERRLDILKQVQNRPHTPSHSECYKKGYADAVANALSQHADCVKCLEEDRVTMLEHDAAIAAKAREDVLDELAKEIDRVSKTWHHACALHEIVKSLRHREVQEVHHG